MAIEEKTKTKIALIRANLMDFDHFKLSRNSIVVSSWNN